MKILLIIVSLCIFLSEVSPSNDNLESVVKEMDSTPNVEEVSETAISAIFLQHRFYMKSMISEFRNSNVIFDSFRETEM